MPGVTKEQIRRAKGWDLLSYLQTYEPGELRKAGTEYYTAGVRSPTGCGTGTAGGSEERRRWIT